MTSKIQKGGAAVNTIIGVILVAVILVVINILSVGNFVRLDLTEGKEFTVSDATKDVLRELDDLVTVSVYMSEDMPTQLSTLRQNVSDLLDEYRNYGSGNLQIDFIDPAGDVQLEQQLRGMGIPQIQAQTLEKDQFMSINIYLGMAISYLDKQEVIPVVQDTYSLEYDLTAAILKVSQDKEINIGVLSGPTVHDLNKGLSGLQELLRKQYNVRTVMLSDGDDNVPNDIDLLLIAGPENISDRIEYRIDQYLMRGGKIVFLMDAVRLDPQGGLQAQPINTGIEDMLAHFGVRVQSALAIDPRSNASATFSMNQFSRMTMPYPYWPRASAVHMNTENPVTNRLESVVFPWAAPIAVDVAIGAGDPIENISEQEKKDREARRELAKRLGMEVGEEKNEAIVATGGTGSGAGGGLIASILIRTSGQSWTVSGQYDLNPRQRFAPPDADKTSSKVTAVALTGSFSSFYNNRQAPTAPDAASTDLLAEGDPTVDTPAGIVPAAAEETPIPSSPETQILVVGNAQFATDQFMAQFPDNALFIQNTIDWMTMGEELISIRSRGATSRPVKELSEGAKSTIKLLCILGSSVLVIAFGLVRLVLRRKKAATGEALARA
jgi:gliding motility-associatede transport system auxiliary component